MTWKDEIRKYEKYLRAKGASDYYIKTAGVYRRALGEAYNPESYLDLTEEQIIDWFNALRKRGLMGRKGLSEASLRSIATHIKSMLRRMNDGETPPSLKGLTIGKATSRVKSKGELVTAEEMERFLEAVDPQKRAIFRLLYATGARPSEVLNLKREDVAFRVHNGLEYLELSFRDTKTGVPREVPLREPKTLQALKDYLEIAPSEGYIFPSPRRKGEPLQYQTLWVCMKRTAQKLGIKKRFYPYLLRHSKATELATAPRAIADKYMGWKSGLMLRNYTHLQTDDLRDYLFETEGLPVDVAVQLKTVIETLMSALEEQAEKDPQVLVSVMEKLRDLSIQG